MTKHAHLSEWALRLSVVFLLLTSLTACSRDESPVTPTDPTRIEANTPQELRNGLDNLTSGATSVYPIDNRLADMDYRLTLRP